MAADIPNLAGQKKAYLQRQLQAIDAGPDGAALYGDDLGPLG